jgi:hypothetical protein
MGTRADFYMGINGDAEWLGSIAYDGYPDDGAEVAAVVAAQSEAEYLAAVATMRKREDWTAPEQGWPWPWETSGTTDYAYGWHNGATWFSPFGRPWRRVEDENGEPVGDTIRAAHPTMSDGTHSAPAGSRRSGIMAFTAKG